MVTEASLDNILGFVLWSLCDGLFEKAKFHKLMSIVDHCVVAVAEVFRQN